jgi:hypothetical protein
VRSESARLESPTTQVVAWTHLPSHPGATQFVSFLQLYEDQEEEDRKRAKRLLTLFNLGDIVLSVGAVNSLFDSDIEPVTVLWRHATGDWGVLDPEDREANDLAAAGDGNRIHSVYPVDGGEVVWVITESDRSATMVVLAREFCS